MKNGNSSTRNLANPIENKTGSTDTPPKQTRKF